MWQDYSISIKYIKSSNDARKYCDVVTLSDESDEDEDDDQAQSIIWENNSVSKRDAKGEMLMSS